MREVLTIREAVARAKDEGLPVSEHTLRCWIKTGAIPVRHAGTKALIYYPNLVKYLQCDGGGDPVAGQAQINNIRTRRA